MNGWDAARWLRLGHLRRDSGSSTWALVQTYGTLGARRGYYISLDWMYEGSDGGTVDVTLNR